MEQAVMNSMMESIFSAIEKMIPTYMANEVDKRIANGNVAICIIDPAGRVYGKLWGGNQIRNRQSYQVAWVKASQVWITGLKTGEYEKLVFSGQVDEEQYGIERPDLIGWEGGQPVTLYDGTILSIGFSGFRGIVDLEIVVKAFESIDFGKSIPAGK